MSAAPQLDPLEPSPLASARLHRKLTIDEAARRAGLSPKHFEPGGDAYGARLGHQLGVEAKPLPGGSNPRRLVVIAGPPRVG